MRHASQDNGMAEIALALAMGFFSIMVLTMISRGSGHSKFVAVEKGVNVVPSTPVDGSGTSSERDRILIHYKGRFLDTELRPIDPAVFDTRGPLVLAVAPGLAFSDVLQARSAAAASNITVTTLDERWLAALKEKFK